MPSNIMLSHHFIKTKYNSSKILPSKIHIQGAYLMHCNSTVNKMGHQM